MRILLTIAALAISLSASAWGQTGHRAVGHIAEQYLSKKAKKKLTAVLNNKSLAYTSTWMDEIRADNTYSHTYDWHWVTIPDEQTYDVAEKNSNGDIIEAIERIMKALEEGNLSAKDEMEHVMMLIHLVGDIHQPLHVGTGEDRGGNDVKVEWFWDNSNLHRVWDSEMIDSKQLSSLELSQSVSYLLTKDNVAQWQNDGVRAWAMESVALRDRAYDLPEDKKIGYRYMYDHWSTVEQRIAQAGVRLAAVLNKIYG